MPSYIKLVNTFWSSQTKYCTQTLALYYQDFFPSNVERKVFSDENNDGLKSATFSTIHIFHYTTWDIS